MESHIVEFAMQRFIMFCLYSRMEVGEGECRDESEVEADSDHEDESESQLQQWLGELENYAKVRFYMSLCVRKSTIWDSNQVRHKPVCAVTEVG